MRVAQPGGPVRECPDFPSTSSKMLDNVYSNVLNKIKINLSNQIGEIPPPREVIGLGLQFDVRQYHDDGIDSLEGD